MKKTLSIGLVVAAFLLGSNILPARTAGDRGHVGGEGGLHSENHEAIGHQGNTSEYLIHLLNHAKDAGLSEKQIATLKALQLDLDLARVTAEADLMLTEREIAALVSDEKADLSAIEAKVKRSEHVEAGLRVLAIKAKRDAMALLTPEQRERF